MWIEKIHIYGVNIQQKDLQALTSNITQLIQLNCLHDAQERIKGAVRCFLQNTIDDMPRHHIELGHPGYQAYEQELLAINDVLILMNHVLYKANIIASSSPLTLQHPSDHVHDIAHLNIRALPPDLVGFVQSIDDSDACKTTWETHFRTVETELLSHYFSKIINMIHESSNQPDQVESILYKLNTFAKSLERRSNLFGIQMMFDVIKGARSPVPRRIPSNRSASMEEEQSALYRAVSTLKTSMNQIFTTNTLFNRHFSQFREALTD